MIDSVKNCSLTLYAKADYDDLVVLYEGEALSHIGNLLINDSPSYVSNVDTEIVALGFGKEVWAITVNEKEYSNAIICSPYTIYVKYPIGTIQKFNKLSIKVLVVVYVSIMGFLCRLMKINKALQVNNNLDSLLKHSNSFNQLLPRLTELLITKYPKHAITFYRVNIFLEENFFHNLKKQGYCVFPDRIAHVFFPESRYMERSHTRRDLSLLRNSPYEIVAHNALTESDADRLCELYQMLFVDKHSEFNPMYTAKYFRDAIKGRWHHYVALRSPEGQIDAFISWFYRENIMICGPLGYNTALSPKVGLYRQLVAICLKHANENQMIFNMGGGSDEFKSNRGSTETMEYTAVYYRHLPLYRRIPWIFLSWVFNKLLEKILKKTKF